MATETLTLSLDNADESVSVTINDTSQTPGPTYSLSASPTSVNEGQSTTWTLTTQNVNTGTSIAYTISGVNSADIGNASLTGNFVVGSSMTRSVTFANDQTSEGTETATLSLNNGQASRGVTVNDTSLDLNIKSTRISGSTVIFRTDPRPPTTSWPQRNRLTGAMTTTNPYGVRPFRTVAFFYNNGLTDVLQAWYDFKQYSPNDCNVGSNYDGAIGYHQVLMWVDGVSDTPSFYQINGSNGFDYNRIILYSGAYGSGQLAYINVP